jgi:hypothetical protein
MLQQLLADMEAWKKNLPESLQYRGPETPRNAGTCFSPLRLCAMRSRESCSVRSFAFALFLRLHDLLAGVYANIVQLPGTFQIYHHRRELG